MIRWDALVCERCGTEVCWRGEIRCDYYQGAGVVTREEFERALSEEIIDEALDRGEQRR